MAVANTPAYFDTATIMAVEIFIVQASWSNICKEVWDFIHNTFFLRNL
jgi:hypothetical protein